MESRIKIFSHLLVISKLIGKNLNFSRWKAQVIFFLEKKNSLLKLELKFIFHLEESSHFSYSAWLFFHWMIVSCVRLMSTFFNFNGNADLNLTIWRIMIIIYDKFFAAPKRIIFLHKNIFAAFALLFFSVCDLLCVIPRIKHLVFQVEYEMGGKNVHILESFTHSNKARAFYILYIKIVECHLSMNFQVSFYFFPFLYLCLVVGLLFIWLFFFVHLFALHIAKKSKSKW